LSIGVERVARPGARRGLGLALIFLATGCFACITTFSRLAFDDGSNPASLLILRFAAFAGFSAVLQILRGRPLRIERAMLGPVVGMAGFMLMLSGGYLVAAAFIPVSLAVILLYTSPFLVALASVLMGREQMTRLKAASMALAFIGVVLAVGLDMSHLDIRGVAAGLTASAGMVLAIVVGGLWMQRIDPISLNFCANLLLLLPVGIYLIATGSFHLPPDPVGRIGLLGATLSYLAGNLFWILSMRLVSPIRMAVILNLETPITIALGAMVLGESLTPLQLLGAAIVVAAVMALTTGGRRSV
jgi:drug/metabolite transporter (DMT)-like permease